VFYLPCNMLFSCYHYLTLFKHNILWLITLYLNPYLLKQCTTENDFILSMITNAVLLTFSDNNHMKRNKYLLEIIEFCIRCLDARSVFYTFVNKLGKSNRAFKICTNVPFWAFLGGFSLLHYLSLIGSFYSV
jgi:hypothetical protein